MTKMNEEVLSSAEKWIYDFSNRCHTHDFPKYWLDVTGMLEGYGFDSHWGTQKLFE